MNGRPLWAVCNAADMTVLSQTAAPSPGKWTELLTLLESVAPSTAAYEPLRPPSWFYSVQGSRWCRRYLRLDLWLMSLRPLSMLNATVQQITVDRGNPQWEWWVCGCGGWSARTVAIQLHSHSWWINNVRCILLNVRLCVVFISTFEGFLGAETRTTLNILFRYFHGHFIRTEGQVSDERSWSMPKSSVLNCRSGRIERCYWTQERQERPVEWVVG